MEMGTRHRVSSRPEDLVLVRLDLFHFYSFRRHHNIRSLDCQVFRFRLLQDNSPQHSIWRRSDRCHDGRGMVGDIFRTKGSATNTFVHTTNCGVHYASNHFAHPIEPRCAPRWILLNIGLPRNYTPHLLLVVSEHRW